MASYTPIATLTRLSTNVSDKDMTFESTDIQVHLSISESGTVPNDEVGDAVTPSAAVPSPDANDVESAVKSGSVGFDSCGGASSTTRSSSPATIANTYSTHSMSSLSLSSSEEESSEESSNSSELLGTKLRIHQRTQQRPLKLIPLLELPPPPPPPPSLRPKRLLLATMKGRGRSLGRGKRGTNGAVSADGDNFSLLRREVETIRSENRDLQASFNDLASAVERHLLESRKLFSVGAADRELTRCGDCGAQRMPREAEDACRSRVDVLKEDMEKHIGRCRDRLAWMKFQAQRNETRWRRENRKLLKEIQGLRSEVTAAMETLDGLLSTAECVSDDLEVPSVKSVLAGRTDGADGALETPSEAGEWEESNCDYSNTASKAEMMQVGGPHFVGEKIEREHVYDAGSSTDETSVLSAVVTESDESIPGLSRPIEYDREDESDEYSVGEADPVPFDEIESGCKAPKSCSQPKSALADNKSLTAAELVVVLDDDDRTIGETLSHTVDWMGFSRDGSKDDYCDGESSEVVQAGGDEGKGLWGASDPMPPPMEKESKHEDSSTLDEHSANEEIDRRLLENEVVRLKIELASAQTDLDSAKHHIQGLCKEKVTLKMKLAETLEEKSMKSELE